MHIYTSSWAVTCLKEIIIMQKVIFFLTNEKLSRQSLNLPDALTKGLSLFEGQLRLREICGCSPDVLILHSASTLNCDKLELGTSLGYFRYFWEKAYVLPL